MNSIRFSIKMGFIAWVIIVLGAGTGFTADDPFSATLVTNDISGRNILTWSYQEGYSGYNIYRKQNLANPYPANPLNGAVPIRAMTDCVQIQNVIPMVSPEWHMIETISGNDTAPFNPCLIAGLPNTATEFQRLQILVRGNWRIAVVAGQGYQDSAITLGTTYYYEIRGIDAVSGNEVVLVSDLQVTSGTPILPNPPATISTIAGDSTVLILWSDVPSAAGFYVYRSLNAAGPYQRINPSYFVTRVETDLNGDPLPMPSNGFTDFQRWDDFGNPIAHIVAGVEISGPTDGVTFYYKVSSVDILGQEGVQSPTTANAQPEDTTPPMTPQEIIIAAHDPTNELEIKWQIITHDVDGHREQAIQGYRVYRFDNPESVTTGIDISGVVPHPAPGVQYLTLLDNDPAIKPPFGEKTFWYRIECIDDKGNVSSLSASAAGYLNDTTPPSHPKGVSAEGYEEYIRVLWDPNPEPDLDGYLIYRSLCDFGTWVCDEFVDPNPTTGGQPKRCPEVFSLIGYLSKDEALQRMVETGGKPYFDDFTIPTGSPICYAYLVKALDLSQNQSGTLPPNIHQEQIVCQRLRDRTPPEAAIITGLMARDDQIIVEWIGAPVQDIAAYHVYRGIAETGPYTFVGGMTVPVPPALPMPLTDPYKPPPVVGCNTIPLAINEDMSAGTLTDPGADPKEIYWYKVVGVDQVGNEGLLEDAVGISTFTYTTALPSLPSITSITEASLECALTVHWEPPLSIDSQGFILFRSTTNAAGPYWQVSEMLTTNEYMDKHVVKGIEYWYRVIKVHMSGKLSPQSTPESGKVTH